MLADRPELAKKLQDLPEEPGVYLWKSKKSEVLYVGKAKSLKPRVLSYLRGGDQVYRIQRMVAEAVDVDWLVTGTEVEALVLENSLIKQNKPRYNINLRDDKNFPHLRLTTGEKWPLVDLVRGPKDDGNLYFGPYAPAAKARKTLRLLAQHFGIRSCKGPIEEKDHRACLYYHLDQCLAPCAKHCTKEEYDGAVKDATLFLRGQVAPLQERLKEKMKRASESEAYERAAHYRDLIRMLEESRQPQRIASMKLADQDAWALHREGDAACLVVGLVREGLVRGHREFTLKNLGDRGEPEILGECLRQYYHGQTSWPDELLLPGPIDQDELTASFLAESAGRKIALVQPRRGAKLERVQWAQQVAASRFAVRVGRGAPAREALVDLAEALALSEPPERIECFDISNLQGSEIVASMVCFLGGEPSKKDYRTFKVRTVTGGPDDFASMREVVGRRYRRQLSEDRELPDLVIIDGGRGQLGAAAAARDEQELEGLPLISLAKKEELIFRRDEVEPLRLDRHSPALRLVQRLRDEAHRTAVGFHRRARKRRIVSSALDAVPGVGPTRRKALLRRFGSVDGIKAASLAELEDAVGPALARKLRQHLGAS
ncbi:MAG: excinuclease ABC subunit UvrC [Acidobacteriota bacterium]